MRFLALLLLAAQMLSAEFAYADTPVGIVGGRLVLHSDSSQLSEPLSLEGIWHFFPGRWIQPAEFPSVATEAVDISVPGVWHPVTKQPELQYGIGTYALDIEVAKALTQPPAIHIQRHCGASEVYFFRNGTPSVAPLFRKGRIGNDSSAEVVASGDLLLTLPPLQAGLYHLLIQQSNFHLSVGGLCGAVTFGDAVTLEHSRTLSLIKNTVVAALLLGLALASLVLGSQNNEKAAPWLALVCVACAMLIAATGGLLDALLPPTTRWLQQWRYGISYSALIWLPPALLMLFRHTLDVALPRWLMVATLISAAVVNIAFVVTPSLILSYPKILIAWWLLQLIVAYAVMTISIRQKRRHTALVLVASLPLLIITPLDIYRYLYHGIFEVMTPYAIAFLCVVHGGIYTLKFGAAYQLAARLSAHLQEEVELRTRELLDKNMKLEAAQIALQRANEALKQLSITDGLTRVHNRMYFEQQFEQEWRRCARQGAQLSVLMIDADHFKQLNDSAGHLVGDLCLQAIAKEIEQHFKRAGELVARYGGEEFIVLLPETNQSKALAVAEGLRVAIERLVIEQTGKQYRVTVSIGVSTTIPAVEQQPSQLIATADAALYEAKDAGRNRVHSIPMLGPRRIMAQQQLHL